MNHNKISVGCDVPNDVNVIIEIPAQGKPVKYEMEKESGALFVDRFMATAMFYPTNYGYIPHTLSEDGDPVDVLVITPVPLDSGVVVRCRPIGMLQMTDEAGEDAKLLAVPVDKLTPLYHDVQTPDDVSPQLLSIISHFFEHYKDLEKGKWVKIGEWVGPDAAKEEITQSVDRYRQKDA